MTRTPAIWSPATILLTCSWCLMDMQTMTLGEVKALGRANVLCRNCQNMNFIPPSLVAQAEHVRAKVDPDNPPGRAAAWDSLMGHPVLKRALEICIVGRHTLTYVGHPQNGWTQVKAILGPFALHMQKCPCGGYLDPQQICTCELSEIQRWRKSRPYIQATYSDILVDVLTPKIEALFSPNEEPYANALARIQRVRLNETFGIRAKIWPNSDAAGARQSNPGVFDIMNSARARFNLKSEQLVKVQRVALTIANMDGAAVVAPHHMAEAVMYRTPLYTDGEYQ
jgi:predicted ATPase with chaperone activity